MYMYVRDHNKNSKEYMDMIEEIIWCNLEDDGFTMSRLDTDEYGKKITILQEHSILWYSKN